MPIGIRSLLAVVCVGLVTACARPGPEETATPTPRYLEDGVLVSTCRPVLRLRPGTGFRYLGAHAVRIGDVADSLTARSLRAFSIILPPGDTPSCAP